MKSSLPPTTPNSELIGDLPELTFLNNDGGYLVSVEVDNEFGHLVTSAKSEDDFVYDLVYNYKL